LLLSIHHSAYISLSEYLHGFSGKLFLRANVPDALPFCLLSSFFPQRAMH